MPRTLAARLAVLLVLGAAMLTSCGGSPERPPAAPVTAGEAAGSPVPQDAPGPPPLVKRDVVKTASMSILVANPTEAADKAAVLVANADGRVDGRSEDAGSGTGRARSSVVLRVPAAKLDHVLGELKALGTVEHVEITSDDVTAQRVDLDARIKALQTSVDRLLGIMRDAKDPDALIKAEGALSERQAELDSLRAQRDALGDRIDYSTVNVTFVAEAIGGPTSSEYRGFFGQIERGWDALVSVVGNLVLLFGLLLPWLAVLAIGGGIVYGVVRLTTARLPKPTPPQPMPPQPMPSHPTPDRAVEDETPSS
ncbi:DUF4349 domain-containing protein [Mycobacterium sp. CVI_P3]|uniref:DUF4349 domain-containing protein n=2 Tax=Mycobacterium pinniadriaticum TaxID=2994102 RepID=A0ABT3SHA3_9MYCO|nr:DUF4349 domain-containing protein [Mycobacterium pinniadriaticum]MCX2932466.1 DUF4349 domain-containing protein [Mycobacterium pinniadriaticum]MCX2938900.1 DUF4349 domain-containing protein [Mycobacterium pinniadriaticum]